jgi:hypothetical protein
MASVDISPDGRALLAVGQDAHAKQVMVLWDISEVRQGGMVSVRWQAWWCCGGCGGHIGGPPGQHGERRPHPGSCMGLWGIWAARKAAW